VTVSISRRVYGSAVRADVELFVNQ